MSEDFISVRAAALEFGLPEKSAGKAFFKIRKKFPELLKRTRRGNSGHLSWSIPVSENKTIFEKLGYVAFGGSVVSVEKPQTESHRWENECASELKAQGFETLVVAEK